MTHWAPKALTPYVTVVSTHSVMSVLITLIDAAVNLFPFFPMNLLWEIFLCYQVAVYIWPFPSKCIYENTVFLFTLNRRKFALRRKCLIRFRSPVLLITVLQRYMRVWCKTYFLWQLYLEGRNAKIKCVAVVFLSDSGGAAKKSRGGRWRSVWQGVLSNTTSV